MSSSDEYRQLRHRQAKADRSRPNDPLPEIEAAHLPFVVPGLGAADGSVLIMQRGNATATPSNFAPAPTDYGVMITGAPLTLDAPGMKLARLTCGRWVAANTLCPCGPVHPQRTVTLTMDFLRATATTTATAVAGGGHALATAWSTTRDTVAIPLPWNTTPTLPGAIGWFNIQPDGPAASAYGWNAIQPVPPFPGCNPTTSPFYSMTYATVGVGLSAFTYCDMATGWAVGSGVFPTQPPFPRGDPVVFTPNYAYCYHYFNLACGGSGFTLTHWMLNNQGSVTDFGGIANFASGYRTVHRGVVTSANPLAITFNPVPDSYSAIDNGQIDSGVERVPNGFLSDIEVTDAGFATVPAASFDPPFGVYALSIA